MDPKTLKKLKRVCSFVIIITLIFEIIILSPKIATPVAQICYE
jgi:hypothetical protein